MSMLIVAALANGCGNHSVLPSPPPANVQVSLLQLAQQTHAWDSVAQFERVEQTSLAPVSAVSAPQLPTIKPVTTAVAQSPAAVHALTVAQTAGTRRTQRALASAAGQAVAQVRARLERDESRLMAIASQQENEHVSLGVQSAREQATQRYLASLPTLLAPGSKQRLDLQVQIDALTVDSLPTNPPTAPDDYWGKLLAARRAALARLGGPQQLADRAAAEQISAQVDTARQALQHVADTELAGYESTLDAHTEQVVARQQATLHREQGDLLAVSAELNRELSQPLKADIKLGSRPTATISMTAPTVAAASTSTAAAAARLTAQRSRLVADVLEATRRRAALAASELNLRVTDWNSNVPDAAAMREITQRMRKDNF